MRSEQIHFDAQRWESLTNAHKVSGRYRRVELPYQLLKFAKPLGPQFEVLGSKHRFGRRRQARRLNRHTEHSVMHRVQMAFVFTISEHDE